MTATTTAMPPVVTAEQRLTTDSSRADASGSENRRPLRLVAELVDGLAQRGIRYCLWKSTPRLEEALTGRTDLDLLVAREDASQFERLMEELGIKPFLSHPDRRYPGLEDHIGLDRWTGKLVHLHVHYELILGAQFVKNHHLPIERLMLSRTDVRQGVRVPVPELELTVLVVRALLKYRDVDWFKDLLRIRTPGLPADTLRELRALAAIVEPDRLDDLLSQELPYLPRRMVTETALIAREHPRAAGDLFRLRRAARAALRTYEREDGIAVRLRYIRARATRQWPVALVMDRPSRRHAKRKTPARGGTTIAFIGIDGSGKSTAVADLVEWLEWRVRVRREYLGSAQPSAPTRIAGLAASWMGRGARGTRRILGDRRSASRAMATLAELAVATRSVGEAFDRMRRARAGATSARAGVVVLFDRYPLPALVLPGRYVDGPRIRSTLRGGNSRLVRGLARVEERAYRRIPPPDHVVVLDLDPQQAKTRKPTRAPARLDEKAAAVAALAVASGRMHIVRLDASRPRDEVRLDTRAAVWSML